jgi:NAD(P)-dependent dehydrogenase (short-subunit alcohol dehydrogenase family)
MTFPDGFNSSDDFGWQQVIFSTSVICLATTYIVTKQSKQRHSESLLRQFKETDLSNKTIVITGSNRGIGKATAEFLASKNAKIILGCRCIENCERAAQDIKSKTGNSNITPMHIDLSDLKSIEHFSKAIPKCHILINNASSMFPNYQTKSGIEATMLTNYIGPMYLSHLMLPTLQNTSIEDNTQTRIVHVGSRLEKAAKIPMYSAGNEPFPLDWIRKGPTNYTAWASYSNSKLCTLLGSLAMSQAINNKDYLGNEGPSRNEDVRFPRVTINTVTPGIVYTDLGRWAPLWSRVLAAPIMHTFLRTPMQGAASVIHASISEDVKQKSGVFLYDGKEILPSSLARSVATAEAVHKETLSIFKEVSSASKE